MFSIECAELAMELAHINSILASLKHNQVTIPVVPNCFEETNGQVYQTLFSKDPFENLDDMLTDVRNKKHTKSLSCHRRDSLSQDKSYSLSRPKVQSEAHRKETASTGCASLFEAFACVSEPILSLQNTSVRKVKALQFQERVHQFVSSCTLKTLNLKTKMNKGQILQLLTSVQSVEMPKDLLDAVSKQLLIELCGKTVAKNVKVLVCDEKETKVSEQTIVCNNGGRPQDTVVIKYNNSTDTYLFEDIVTDIATTEPSASASLSTSENKVVHETPAIPYSQENLKSMNVKDLRQYAQDNNISIVDPSTQKQYSKSELRHLVESKLKTRV